MEMTVKPVVADPMPVPQAPQLGGRAIDLQEHQAARPAPWRWLSSALSGFIDVFEPVVARCFAGARLIVVESPTEDQLAFHRVSGRRSALLGTSSEDRDLLLRKLKRARTQHVELRLDPGRFVNARFSIPFANAEFAPQIVESKLDRLSPWRADAIFYGFALARKPKPDGQLELDFAATSKSTAAASLTRLTQFGLKATMLGSAAQPIGERLSIDLFGGRNDSLRIGRRRAIGLLTVFVMLVSIVTFGASLYLVNESNDQISQLESTLTKARSRLVKASEPSGERDKDRALIAAKVRSDARFLIIDRLATILPDSTYLDELDIEERSIRIGGVSSEVSGLIKLLEDDPLFSEVKYAAAVTRQDDGSDRFEIVATLGATTTESAP